MAKLMDAEVKKKKLAAASVEIKTAEEALYKALGHLNGCTGYTKEMDKIISYRGRLSLLSVDLESDSKNDYWRK